MFKFKKKLTLNNKCFTRVTKNKQNNAHKKEKKKAARINCSRFFFVFEWYEHRRHSRVSFQRLYLNVTDSNVNRKCFIESDIEIEKKRIKQN